MALLKSMNAEAPPTEMLHPILTRKQARCSQTSVANNGDSPGRLCMPRTNSAKSASPSSDAAPSSGVDEKERVPVSSPISADADTLARAQSGDHHAFAQLYSLHKRRIYSLCLRMVSNAADGRELCANIVLIASSVANRTPGDFIGVRAFCYTSFRDNY